MMFLCVRSIQLHAVALATGVHLVSSALTKRQACPASASCRVGAEFLQLLEGRGSSMALDRLSASSRWAPAASAAEDRVPGVAVEGRIACSATVGTSGSWRARCWVAAPACGSPWIPPAEQRRHAIEHQGNLAATRSFIIGEERDRHVRHVHARDELELLPAQMKDRAETRRAIRVFAGVCLQQRHQLLHVLRGDGGMDGKRSA